MTEAQIQAAIIKYLTAEGWQAIKLIQTNTNGIPDIMALRMGVAMFIEVKRPGGKVADLQTYRIRQLKQNGFIAFIARSVDDVKHEVLHYQIS